MENQFAGGRVDYVTRSRRGWMRQAKGTSRVTDDAKDADQQGHSDAWADPLVEVLRKQPALSGKLKRKRPAPANTKPLEKYRKQRGMLEKQ